MRARVFGVLRWLAPWGFAVGVSTAIAFAAGQGLTHMLGPVEVPAQPSPGKNAPMRQIQIVLLHADRPSTVLECLAYANNVTDDVLEFWDAPDAAQAIRGLCLTPVKLVDGTGRPR